MSADTLALFKAFNEAQQKRPSIYHDMQQYEEELTGP